MCANYTIKRTPICQSVGGWTHVPVNQMALVGSNDSTDNTIIQIPFLTPLEATVNKTALKYLRDLHTSNTENNIQMSQILYYLHKVWERINLKLNRITRLKNNPVVRATYHPSGQALWQWWKHHYASPWCISPCPQGVAKCIKAKHNDVITIARKPGRSACVWRW